jgi:glucose/arabinose dehydrogenase
VTRRSAGWAVALATAGLVVAACGAMGPAASGDGLVPIGAGLSGPAGLRATVYASGPPTVAALALDGRGRLWLTAAAYAASDSDGVYVVERRGARPQKVVSGLRTPLGLTWASDRLFVASAGRVDAYGDLAGTRFGRDDTVVAWPVDVGELDNLVVAPDGRLLAGVSAPCDHCVPSSPWSASIVSLAGGGAPAVFASGIRAPFGLVFRPGTDDLFVTMNQRDDLGARTPGDWLAVVRQGQRWGFPGCYGQGGAACAGVPAPVATLDRHGAVGGVAIVTGQLGPATGTAALVAEWRAGRVQRVALDRPAAGSGGPVTPFLRGIANPLPVLATPDGAVLFGDWKTGRIYRIARA